MMVFNTRHAYAVSFWIFLMMMTGWAGKQKIGACFNQNGWCYIKTAKNGYDINGKRGPGSNAHVLSNMAWFLKYWICFWTGIIEDGWRISTLRRFWKYWIWKPYFTRRIRGVSIQYFRNEGLLDIWRNKLFSEARNTYPLLKSVDYSIIRLYAYVWFRRKLSNKRHF